MKKYIVPMMYMLAGFLILWGFLLLLTVNIAMK